MIKVGVLGATGLVGQRLINMLRRHPWFKIASITASERSVGKRYGEAVKWHLSEEVPEEVACMEVVKTDPKELNDVSLVFSSLPAEAANIEKEFAQEGFAVVSNARLHRLEPDIPLINPEVNPEHLSLIDVQRERRRWDGFIVASPNCTTTILTLSLKPIYENFGVRRVIASSMQALSGAGYPGVPSLDIVDNVIPFIKDEEEKVEKETVKILGKAGEWAPILISASCHRVPSLEGHLIAVFTETLKPSNPQEVMEAMKNFKGEPQKLKLPTAPEPPIIVRSEEDRPQVRLDRTAGGGMAIVVGRVRRDQALNGVKYIVLGHNTIRGAAGCAILNAELLKSKGYI